MLSVGDAVFIPQQNLHVADTSGAAGVPPPGAHCDAAEPAGTSDLLITWCCCMFFLITLLN